MKKKLLFRADGDSSIGLGHLYRLMAMADMLKEDYGFCFVVKQNTVSSIFPEDFKVVSIPQEADSDLEADWLVNEFPPQEYIMVIDGYQFTNEYQRTLKGKHYKLIYVDDFAQGHMVADVVINAAPSLGASDFSYDPTTRFGLGPKYALLRSSFLKAAQESRTIETIDTAFVCFGGADKLNLTVKTAKALLKLDQIGQINVVLGSAYQDGEILEMAKRHEKLKIHRALSEDKLVELMSLCNVGIVPSSTILYELCCVKMPILSGYFVENQKLFYLGLLQGGAIYGGGDIGKFSVADFGDRLCELLGDPDIDGYLKRQGALFDGKNRQRIRGLVNALNISYRKADERDLEITLAWANDPLVRSNSFNSRPIGPEEHTEWFLSKISSKNALFLVPLINREPAGLVRYESKGDYSLVGILIDKKYRGQNLSPIFLRESAKLYFEQNRESIRAFIKKKNTASVRAFENAGYSYYGMENSKEDESVIYQLEKQDAL